MNRSAHSAGRRAPSPAWLMTGAALLSPTGSAAEQPSPATMQIASRAVAKVVARFCGDETPVRAGTAFLWGDKQTIVTARHVVAGCSVIEVSFASTGQKLTAVPTRELRSRDLVLLRAEQPINADPLKAIPGLPGVGDKVAALGFGLGAPTLDSKMLEVTLANTPPGSRLTDMLPPSLKDQLTASGELDLQTNILRFDGNLLPGHSGAPLIDSAGRVRGIGSGGLQSGASGVVWGLRADYLDELAAASETSKIEAATLPAGLTFAYQTEQGDLRKVQCGVAALTYSRTVPLSDLYSASDDKLGLQQLAATANLAQLGSGEVKFDVWLDAQTGASFAVPAGQKITAAAGECTISISPEVTMVIDATDVTGATPLQKAQQVQNVSGAFATLMSSKFTNPLYPDGSFTYLAPLTRPDGFTVRRMAFVGNSPGPTMNQMRSDYLFLTHMTRGTRYYGVATLRRNFLMDWSKFQTCSTDPAGQTCTEAKSTFRDWSISSVAVHLATMPPI